MPNKTGARKDVRMINVGTTLGAGLVPDDSDRKLARPTRDHSILNDRGSVISAINDRASIIRARTLGVQGSSLPLQKFYARLLTAALLVFVTVSGVFAQQQSPTGKDAPAAALAPDAKKIDQAAATAESLVTEFNVNGLKVLVKRRASSPTVAAGLFVRGGARNITAQNAGVEPLMWDTATEASQSFPRDVLRKELARMGTQLGYSINYDYSVLSLGSTRQNFERSWDIFADVALRPSFAPEDFQRVKSRMIVARSGENDTPDSYLEVLQSKIAYAGHPYLNDPEGTAESIPRLTLEDVRRFHQQILQTSRLLLVVVGDIDPNTVRDRVAASFGKLPPGDYRADAPPPLAYATPRVEFTQLTIPTNYVQGIFAAPPITDPDIYPMRIASALLRDRVFNEVRVRRNLSYAPNAFMREQGANLGGIYVTATAANTNEAISVMLAEIARLQREPIDPSEISSQVSGYLTQYYIGQETNAAQAGELAKYELIGGGWRNSAHLIERLRAVTPGDVQRVARKYMRNLQFVVLGDPSKVDKTLFTARAGE